MPPKAAPVDYSALTPGTRLQAESDGVYYAAEVVEVSKNKKRAKAPVKVSFIGYAADYDEWVGASRIRSKALKAGAEPPAKDKKEKPAKKAAKAEKTEKQPPPPLKLVYFGLTGRGEPIRMAAKVGKVAMEDVRHTGEEWQNGGKEKSKTGQCPYLCVGDQQIAQSLAILRFIGRLGRLYPKGLAKAALVDEMLYMLEDWFFIPLTKTNSLPSDEEKVAARKLLIEEDGKVYIGLKKLDDILGSSESGWVVDPVMTIADLAVWGTVCFYFESPYCTGVNDIKLLDKFPNITKFRAKMAEVPALKLMYKDSAEDPFRKCFMPLAEDSPKEDAPKES